MEVRLVVVEADFPSGLQEEQNLPLHINPELEVVQCGFLDVFV